jgi:hypothetical protein
MIMKTLVTHIKRKKELASLSDQFVNDELKRYFITHPALKKFLSQQKSKQYKQIVKDVRAELRKIYGLFRERGRSQVMLKSHASTRERLSYYETLYKKIFKITGTPKVVLDLGCGVNPFSYKFIKAKITYYAYDIDEEESGLINDYFSQEKIVGKAEVKDITRVKQFPRADIVFLFKVTDMLDRGKGHKKTEELLQKLPVTYAVVSFPTKTMSGKHMNVPQRPWFERLCKRLEWNYSLLEFPNEIYYVVKLKK